MVRREEDEGAPVGHGEVDRHTARGIEQGAVQRGGHAEGPELRIVRRVPDARGIAVEAEAGHGTAPLRAEGGGQGAVETPIGAQCETALPYPIAQLAVEGESQRCRRRRRRYRDHCGGAGAIGEGGGEGEGATGAELVVGMVRREEDEGAPVGHGEGDRHTARGIEQGAVQRGGHAEGPELRIVRRVPDARGIAVEAEAGHGTAPLRAEGGGQGAVERPIGAQGDIALPYPIAQLAVEGESQRCRRRRRRYRDHWGGAGAIGEGGREGEAAAGRVRVRPGRTSWGGWSGAKRTKVPPSATGKLTAILPGALSRGLSSVV